MHLRNGSPQGQTLQEGSGVASMPGCKCRTDGTSKVAERQKRAEIPGFRGVLYDGHQGPEGTSDHLE